MPATAHEDCPTTDGTGVSLPRPPGLLDRLDPVILLLVLHGILYMVADLLGGTTDPGVLISLGANYPEYVARGEVWRFLGSMFLHAGPLHLIVNGYSLFILGRFVTRLYGRTQFLAVFVASGILASLASHLFTSSLSVGSSGGIAGLLGLVAAFVLRFRGQLAPDFRRRFLLNLNLIVAINVVISTTIPGIDAWAHAGGFAAGMAAGWIVRTVVPGARAFRSPRTLPRVRVATLGLLLLTWVSLGCYLLFALALPEHSPQELYRERSGLFQFRYPAWFTVRQAADGGDEALLVTNLHDATVAVFLIDEDEYHARLEELARYRAERGPVAINGMEGVRAAGVEDGHEGPVFYYQVLLLGAKNTGGEKLAAVFLATGDAPVSARLRALTDRIAAGFYFVNRLVI